MKLIFDDILKIHKPKPKYKILTEITNRWSPRFYSNEKVSQKHLNIIFEAARWAPSGHNNQPWQYFYTQKNTKSYKKLFATLNDYNQSWAKTAPMLILACAETINKHGENPYAFYDLGASVVSLILQAQSLGYYSRQMALFDQEKVKKIFNINPNLQPFIIIAMGRIGDYENAPPEIINTEIDPRPRKINIVKKLH